MPLLALASLLTALVPLAWPWLVRVSRWLAAWWRSRAPAWRSGYY